MTYFYTNHKHNILTITEDILLFSTIVKQEIISVQGENNLLILRPDRPDLVLSVLLACQDESDQILISKSEEQDSEFLKHFNEIQTLETHHLIQAFERFKQNLQAEVETPDKKKLRQDICHDNNSHVWFRSSGSSGKSKYIQHHFQNFVKSTQLSHQSYLHIVKEINWALNLSIDHIGGFMALFRSFYLGHRVQQYFWKQPTDKDTSNVFSLVPTQVHWLIDQAESHAAKLFQQAQMVVISGGEISASLVKKIRGFKSNGHVVFTYGATETCSQIAVGFYNNDLEQIEYRPFKEVNIECLNKTALINSPTNCQKLFESSIKKIDIVQLHDEIEINNQRFIIKGRSDQIIVSGGENISLNKVKMALNMIDPDNTFTLAGVPSEKWGSELICFASNPYNLTVEELKQSLRNEFEPFEIPKAFYQLKFVKISGIKPSLEELEKHHKLNNSPWITFHGFMGDQSDWNKLLEHGIENHIPINLNELLSVQNWKDTSETIIQIIQEKIPPEQSFNLIGYSMGARVLLSIVRPLRERIKRVVIVSSHFGDILDSRAKLDRKTKDEALFNNVQTQEQWDSFLDNWYNLELFTGIKNQPDYQQLIDKRRFEKIEDYKKQLEIWTVSNMPNYLITYPKELIDKTLIITGDLDKKYSDYAISLAARKNISHKIIKGHSHALLLSAPDQIFQCL
jgi:O-succinylbenzoic acid--CoA ligase